MYNHSSAPTTISSLASTAWITMSTVAPSGPASAELRDVLATTAVIPNATDVPSATLAGKVDDAPDLINNEFVQIFFCILYTTVFVLGVFGNVLVCYVVLRNRAMQTVTNIFITNLALSDILLCVLAVPFTPLYTFMGRWAFGRTLCHLVSFAQGCSIYISTLTLTSIAVDRYFVIIYPFHPRMKLSTCIAIIVSIWVVALLATLPYGMYMKVASDISMANGTVHTAGQTGPNDDVANYSLATGEWNNGTDVTTIASTAEAYMQVMVSSVTPSPETLTAAGSTTTYCEENWPSEQYRKVFGSVTTILQFVLPFLIISICYTWVSIKLNARARSKPGTKSSRKEEADRDRKKRTNRMLISMVAVFGLSWLPINVVNIFDDFYEKSNEWRFYTLFFFVAHSIAMSSTCYNPFLYAWLNENFRKEFKHVLPCFNPSNNNIINITRGYNRSDRNTCGPRLHHRNGGGGGAGGAGGATIDMDDNDDNGITQDTSLPKEKLPIIPREATYGNGGGSTTGVVVLNPSHDQQEHQNDHHHHQQHQHHHHLHLHHSADSNTALVHKKHVDIILNENNGKRGRRGNRHQRHRRNNTNANDDDYDYEYESGDEQTIEMRFSETPFVSSDNATAISMLEASSQEHDNDNDNGLAGCDDVDAAEDGVPHREFRLN